MRSGPQARPHQLRRNGAAAKRLGGDAPEASRGATATDAIKKTLGLFCALQDALKASKYGPLACE
jgi:hypothetical protein